MKLSVIMTVFNNEEILKISVPALFEQSLSREDYEVIIIDDHSSDKTYSVLKDMQATYPFTLLMSPGVGVAAARNAGVNKAQNPIIQFIQDDIIASPDLLKTHLEFHKSHPDKEYAAVGYITWDPSMEVTPFMDWLEHGGPQFDFDRFSPDISLDYLAFYTPNVSLKKNFIIEVGGFDEDFKGERGVTAYEDTEFGFRLFKAGMQLFYLPSAKVFHHHVKTLANVCKRRYVEGKLLSLLYEKHPDFTFTPQKQRSFWYSFTHLKTDFLPDNVRFQLTRFLFNRFTVTPLEKLAYVLETRARVPLLYKIVCGYHYNRGIDEGNH